MSPGVAIAWRAPARNSWNGCNSAGRGAPNSRSQTSDPNETMQDNRPSRSRNPTARNRLAMSAQSARTAASASRPGLDRYDEKDRGRCERPRHQLRQRTRLPRPPRRAAHSIVSVGSCPRARPARPAPLRPRPCDRRRVRARARCAIAVAARRRQPAADDRRARMIASRPSCHRQSTAAKPAPRIVSSWVSIPPISPKRS